MLFVIPCRFQLERDSSAIDGLAICSDPNTPVTFIHGDGSAVRQQEMWTYRLLHFKPWSKFDLS